MAIALGMDALSVGMGMGMIPLRFKQIFKIGLTIGVFHVIMPLAGMLIGDVLSHHFGKVALLAGGVLLLLLGAQMIFYSFQKNESPMVRPVGIGLILFALSVSLDSFSVGLSLGIYGAKIVVTVILFGFVSMIMTWMGLLIGRKFQKLFGSYSEALGGCVLFAFGIKLLLHM
ncbi:manganese efflux pump MntP [Pullulanibacillus camelliae]|nr:manganese efflux pump MntP family protein [Pullulanibacillus camelliae]